ncbi:MAG: hypothetical protein PUC44_03950, partial [Eubacteriales bacterium]|nr:hypothetical protein [Eubacteriales bacterium]
ELMECLLLAEQNFLLPGEIRICDEDIYVKKRQADVLFAGLVFHRDPIPETQAEGEKKIRNELISILKKRNQEGSLMECMDQGIEILERGRSGISILMNRFRCLAEESRAVDRIIRSEKRT